MMKRDTIKKILREETTYEIEKNLFPYTETETHTTTDIAIGLMHKAMNHLASALRDIESAMQFAYEADTNNEELIEGLEDIRKSLLHGSGQGAGWNGTEEHDNIINQLGQLIDKYSENTDNFNLNGDHDQKAPTGDFQ
tara:strand:+ start:374 stop:787 length:414 start_codon:yes stop_codon:yes gene_type:complete